MEDIKEDLIIPYADAIIFGETWLYSYESTSLEAISQSRNDTNNGECFPAICQNINNENPDIQINGYKLHLNSKGRGKGLAVYFKESKFETKQDINKEDLQITVLQSEYLTVIGLYRSNGDTSLKNELMGIIPENGSCLVIGDFNICTSRTPKHEVFQMLQCMDFKQIVSEATHYAGGHLDQAWLRSTEVYNTQIYIPYYTCKDHDALLFTLYYPRIEGN